MLPPLLSGDANLEVNESQEEKMVEAITRVAPDTGEM